MDTSAVAEGEDAIPQEGDTSICMNCGQVLTYRADLTLRKMTATEVSELMNHREAWAVIEKAQMFIRRRGRLR